MPPAIQLAANLKRNNLASFFYTFNRANSHTLGAIILVITFVARIRIDYVDIPFGYRRRRTFRLAQPTGGAFIGNKHSHDNYSFNKGLNFHGKSNNLLTFDKFFLEIFLSVSNYS